MAQLAEIPSQLGRYRILGKLGAGGMGVVLLAEDTALNRQVAVKVPLKVDDPSALDRFLREAKLAAQLDHPNLCPIHDIGSWQGLPYFVMPFIHGEPLALHIERRWRPREATALVIKVGQAVEVLHRAGIVHRDLKPQNILLRDGREPVVMDFGLAVEVRDGRPEKLTRMGPMMGTPGFIAPEQMLRQAHLIGPCGVLSAGQISFDGRHPFGGPPEGGTTNRGRCVCARVRAWARRKSSLQLMRQIAPLARCRTGPHRI